MPRAILQPQSPLPGRGIRRHTEPATELISVRVTSAEKSALHAEARARGQTLSELLRDCAAGELGLVARRPVCEVTIERPARVDAAAAAELRRIGGLLASSLADRTITLELVAEVRRLLIGVRVVATNLIRDQRL